MVDLGFSQNLGTQQEARLLYSDGIIREHLQV